MINAGSPQFLFIAEQEGWTNVVNTRTARINALIKSIKSDPRPILPERVFWNKAKKYDLEDLTKEEIEDIIQRIR